MIKIFQKEEKVLRQDALPVDVELIGKKKIKDILVKLSQALREQDDGVAIAAPQIGLSLRIFVVAGKIFDKDYVDGKNAKPSPTFPDLIFINPEIIKMSKDKKSLPEGCLSVRWLYGTTRRASKVTVRAYDEQGRLFEHEAKGLLAQVFQHEVDHLNGILFTDHAKNVQELPPDLGQIKNTK